MTNKIRLNKISVVESSFPTRITSKETDYSINATEQNKQIKINIEETYQLCTPPDYDCNYFLAKGILPTEIEKCQVGNVSSFGQLINPKFNAQFEGKVSYKITNGKITRLPLKAYTKFTEILQQTVEKELYYTFDGDNEGLIYYLGTSKLTTTFQNPTTNSSGLSILASTELNGEYAENVADKTNSVWVSTNTNDNWIAIELPLGKSLSLILYSFKIRFPNYEAKDYILQATNNVSSFTIAGINSATWIDLNIRNETTPVGSGNWRTNVAGFDLPYYRYFRFIQQSNFTVNNLNNIVGFEEIEFYGSYS